LLVGVLFFMSCGVSKTVIQSKRVIKGNWVLNSITHDQTGTFNINLLLDVSQACFEGSDWQFIPNNNSGLYTISNSGCASGERYFIFTIQEINPETGLYNFLLKPTSKLGSAGKNSKTGFRFELTHLDVGAMQWQQTVTVDDSFITVSLNFTKSE